jgi:G3E family GTPase
MKIRQRVPVFVITGLLGSGKTTLLSRLLRDVRLTDSLVVVNEFASIGLDHHLLAGPAQEVILLENGCLCCSMQGDLVATLREVARQVEGGQHGFARVLIETSGIADPVGILRTLTADPVVAAYLFFQSVLTVVDTLNWREQIEDTPEALRQIAVADHLVITKTDMVEATERADILRCLVALTPAQVHVADGAGFNDALLAVFIAGEGKAELEAQGDLWLLKQRIPGTHSHTNAISGTAGHDICALSTVVLRREEPVTEHALVLWLNLLGNFHGGQLLRVKGIVNVEGRPTLINGVRQVIHQVVTLARWPDSDRTSRIVFIGYGIRSEALSAINGALECRDVSVSEALDPERYRAFSSVFARMRT